MSENTPICPNCGAEHAYKLAGLDGVIALLLLVGSGLSYFFVSGVLDRFDGSPLLALFLSQLPILYVLLVSLRQYRCIVCGTSKNPTTAAYRATLEKEQKSLEKAPAVE